MRNTKVTLFAGVVVVALISASGSFLVVDAPRKSDVIVVLAGETELRPAKGLQLFDEGYAPLLILDVPAEGKVYQWTEVELAERYVQRLTPARSIKICPIYGTSTKTEMFDVKRCLEPLKVNSVLLETSDYHTRRALSIFRRLDRSRTYSMAACLDGRSFGSPWWLKREWAKTNFYEISRLLWWYVVDRWL